MTHSVARPTLFAALLLSLTASALVAQSPAEVLARYNKAIDPTGKIPSIQGMKSTISMDIPAAGMSATINAVQSRPNRMAMTIEIPGLGQMKQGYDGSTAWGSDPMQGPRIITGAEAASLVDGANFEAMARDPKLFSKVEAAGAGEVNGEKTTCLKLTWKSERVTTECFSTTSGLLLESRTKQQSQMGEIEAVSRMSDYRNIDGIMVPHKMTQSAMGMEQVMTTTSVSFGPQDAKLFELPPEIKALKDK
jgi:zinc protease